MIAFRTLAMVPLLGVCVLGCGSHPNAPTRQDRALEAAKRCAQEEPHMSRGIHGSHLILERGRVQHSDDSGDVVHFPEEQPRGSPMGLTLHIDAQTGECTALPI